MANNFETTNINLLSIGDASLDTFITPTESETLCNLDDKECLICFSYGDKIPVKDIEVSMGGNAANNSVGATRLGIRTALVATIGDDEISNQIFNSLQNEKVDTTFVLKEKAGRSNSSTVVSYSGERTIFVYHAPRTYTFPNNLPETPWLYLTSMGENFKPFYDELANWLSKTPNKKLAFNPGSWQLRSGVNELSKILSLTEVLFVNKEEAEMLTGIKKHENNQKDLLKALNNLGVKIPIITDGQNGAFAYSLDKRFLKLGILPTEAIERTGAGDAFGSGCLSALIKGKPLEEALVWGMVNSTSVISFVGSQKGLLHDSEIASWLERCKSSNLKTEEF